MKFKLFSIVIMVLFLTACESNPLIVIDSEKVLDATEQIVNFPIPSGYKTDFYAHYKDYSLVSYQPENKNSHLYFLQSTNTVDEGNLQKIFNLLVPGSSDKESRQEVLENFPIIVRGKESTMIHTKGINSDGKDFQQVLIAFDGKGGPALFVYSALSEDWDLDYVVSLVKTLQ